MAITVILLIIQFNLHYINELHSSIMYQALYLCKYRLHNMYFLLPLFIACLSFAHQDFFSLTPSFVLNSYISAPIRNCRQEESLEAALL